MFLTPGHSITDTLHTLYTQRHLPTCAVGLRPLTQPPTSSAVPPHGWTPRGVCVGLPGPNFVAQEHQGCGVRVPLPIEPHSAKSSWLVSSIVVVFRLSCCCSNKRGAPASPMFPLRPKFRHRSQAQPSGWPLTTIPPCLDCARPRAPPEAK